MGPGLLDKDDLGGIIGNDWIPGDPEIINDLGQRGPIGATPDAYNKLLALGNRLESGFDPNNEVEGQPNTLVELVDETKELIGILSNQNPERKGQKKKGAKNKRPTNWKTCASTGERKFCGVCWLLGLTCR